MSPSLSVRLLRTQNDARLLALARDGHERAFEALVQRYRRPLLGYCRRILLPDTRAEDAVQQAFLQAWLALENGVEVLNVRAWLYRITHNAALNTLRVSGYDYCKLSETLSGADAPQEDLDRRIAVREALAGLAALPKMQREALLRTAVEGRSHQQVAVDLGVSETALRGLVYRARSALRAAVTAFTPTPLVSWISSAGTRGTPLAERLTEAGAYGGPAGVTGLLLKGGAVVVTAGALAGGVGVDHARRRATSPGRPRIERASRSPSAVPLFPSSSRIVASVPRARGRTVIEGRPLKRYANHTPSGTPRLIWTGKARSRSTSSPSAHPSPSAPPAPGQAHEPHKGDAEARHSDPRHSDPIATLTPGSSGPTDKSNDDQGGEPGRSSNDGQDTSPSSSHHESGPDGTGGNQSNGGDSGGLDSGGKDTTPASTSEDAHDGRSYTGKSDGRGGASESAAPTASGSGSSDSHGIDP